MSRQLAAAALALLGVACNPTLKDGNKDGIADGTLAPNTVTAVVPATPVGTISGQVLSTLLRPLPDSDVKLVLGGRSDSTGSSSYATKTDADGTFSFKDVPAGATGEIIASHTDNATVRFEVTIPAATGQFPLDNGNGNVGVLLLTELTTDIKFNVFTAKGMPAKGVQGLLEVTPAGFRSSGVGTYGTSLGVVSGEATVDDTGLLTFGKMPDPAEMARVGGTYTLTLGALDEDGDGKADDLGTVLSYAGSTLFTRGEQTIVMDDARASNIEILATNLDSLNGGLPGPFRNSLKPTDNIYVVFNQAVIEATLGVKVVGEDCATTTMVSKTLRSGNVLVISPATSWQNGREYNLSIRATGLASGRLLSAEGYFFGADPGAPLPLGGSAQMQYRKLPGNTNAGVLQNGDSLYVQLDAPMHFVGGPGARAFFDADLNGNGSVGGNDRGEFGSPFDTGFEVAPAEITFDAASGTFSCTPSTYTSRFQITLAGLPLAGLAAGTRVKVIFPKDSSSTDGYQTIWGAPFSGEVTGTLTNIP